MRERIQRLTSSNGTKKESAVQSPYDIWIPTRVGAQIPGGSPTASQRGDAAERKADAMVEHTLAHVPPFASTAGVPTVQRQDSGESSSTGTAPGSAMIHALRAPEAEVLERGEES